MVRLSPNALLLAATIALAASPAIDAAAAGTASGGELYRDCAACHGADGGGVADGTVPAIGGQPARVIAKQLADFRAARRLDLRMQHFADDRHLDGPIAVGAVAVYIEGLRRSTAVATGSGRELAAGEREYLRQCAACHGPAGAAVAAAGIPALAGQHAPYLERRLQEASGALNSLSTVHGGLVKGLGADRVAAIADWLSRQAPPGTPAAPAKP
jgi:cytochrome c553